jgi:glutamate-5-semialdehyde dehydrogenase
MTGSTETEQSGVPASVIAREAGSEATRARAAHARLLMAKPAQLRSYFAAVAERLRQRRLILQAANDADLAAAEGAYSAAILDRGRLTPARVESLAGEQLAMAAAPEVVGRVVRAWTQPNGIRFREVRHPLGLIAAVFEARYNVLLDIAGQSLKSRNVVLLKGGRMLARTDAAMVDEVARPALELAGLPAAAVGFMRIPDRACAVAMLDQRPDACIGRGGNELITMLAAECARRGIELIAHDKGGAWLYIDREADPVLALRMIENSLDRRGVCNRLNVLLVHPAIAAAFLPQVRDLAARLGVTLHGTRRAARYLAGMAPFSAADLDREWLSDDITVHVPASWQDAVALANRHSTGIGLSACTPNARVAARMAYLYGGTYFGHNAITRFNDGFQVYGRPETGIVTRTTTGARGAVTYVDLTQRKLLATGGGSEHR